MTYHRMIEKDTAIMEATYDEVMSCSGQTAVGRMGCLMHHQAWEILGLSLLQVDTE